MTDVMQASQRRIRQACRKSKRGSKHSGGEENSDNEDAAKNAKEMALKI